jgi:hypothetical protein
MQANIRVLAVLAMSCHTRKNANMIKEKQEEKKVQVFRSKTDN